MSFTIIARSLPGGITKYGILGLFRSMITSKEPYLCRNKLEHDLKRIAEIIKLSKFNDEKKWNITMAQIGLRYYITLYIIFKKPPHCKYN